MSRSQMLKRSLAAVAGLTVLSSPSRAPAATPPLNGTSVPLETIVARARREGHLNTIALPPDWANYGEILSTFHAKYGIKLTRANPEGSSEQENQAIVALRGTGTAPDVVDVTPAAAIAGAAAGLYGRYLVSEFSSIPRAMKDTRGYWFGGYWGTMSIGYNQALVKTPPASWKDLLKPEYKGKVALSGDPLTSSATAAAVLAAALANGGSLQNVAPGVDFFASLKRSGNLIPTTATSVTIASGQAPIAIDWDYTNLAYVSALPSASWKVAIPADGVYGTYWAQAINATAPHPWTARLWEEFLFSDQGQLLLLQGLVHPARFSALVARRKVPRTLAGMLPAASLYTKTRFASTAQQTAARTAIAEQWPVKVG